MINALSFSAAIRFKSTAHLLITANAYLNRDFLTAVVVQLILCVCQSAVIVDNVVGMGLVNKKVLI